MYRFGPEEELRIRDKAKELIGKPLRSKELCEELNIESPKEEIIMAERGRGRPRTWRVQNRNRRF